MLDTAVTVPSRRLVCIAVARAVCPLGPEAQGARAHVPQTGRWLPAPCVLGVGFLSPWPPWSASQKAPEGASS